MRILVQRVLSSSVSIEGKKVSEIGKGFLLLVGFTHGDDEAIVKKMLDKMLKLRIFADENGKTNLSLAAVGGEDPQRQLRQQQDVRQRRAVFPLRHRLRAHPQMRRQLLLRNLRFLAKRL